MSASRADRTPGPRIVSLVPSATETLVALRRTPVACTRFCEQPILPTVGGTKNPAIGAIVDLAPDVVVMNDEENRREDFDALRGAGLTVVDVSPRSVADVGDAVARLAAVADATCPAPFDDWSEWLDARRTARPERTAVTMVWRRPWMALGRETYGASVLGATGIDTPFGDARYPEVTLDAVVDLAPDLVLLPSEPYAFGDRHAAEIRRAVLGVDVRRVDGQDLFWWGIRTPDALSRLTAELG